MSKGAIFQLEVDTGINVVLKPEHTPFPDRLESIRVTKDGELQYLEYDIEYDLAFMAMSGWGDGHRHRLVHLNFLDHWNDQKKSGRLGVAQTYFLLKSRYIPDHRWRRLAFDLVKHVAWVYREAFSGSDRLDRAIAEVERCFRAGYQAGPSSLRSEDRFWPAFKLSQAARDEYMQWRGENEFAAQAADSVISALEEVLNPRESFALKSIGHSAAYAFARIKHPLDGAWSPAFVQEQEVEEAWQVRRLVDVGHSWNIGGKWPALEATK
jgi:hypothetical protein